MNLLVFDLAVVPATAESFHQINRADHLRPEQLCPQPFAGQQSSLRSDDVEVTGDSADVAIVGDRQCAARILDRSPLRRESLRERAQIADAVFDLLKRREHGLPVVRHRLLISGACGGQIRAISSAFKYGLQSVRTQRPEEARRVEQRPQITALPSAGTA